MHQSGVVTHLLRLIGSEDEDVQVCVKFFISGHCYENSFIRRLLLTVSRISGNWLWRVRNLDTNISSHDETKRSPVSFLIGVTVEPFAFFIMHALNFAVRAE